MLWKTTFVGWLVGSILLVARLSFAQPTPEVSREDERAHANGTDEGSSPAANTDEGSSPAANTGEGSSPAANTDEGSSPEERADEGSSSDPTPEGDVLLDSPSLDSNLSDERSSLGAVSGEPPSAEDGLEPQRDQPTESPPWQGRTQVGSPNRPAPEGQATPPSDTKQILGGRKEPTRAEDILIWIPRAPLLPVHLLLDYGVRRPVVALVTAAEKHQVPAKVQGLLTFSDRRGGVGGVYPVGFYDVGRGFWGGLNFFYNDLGTEGHRLRATAGYGTNQWIAVSLKDTWSILDQNRGSITFSAAFVRDPTLAFAGLGPDSSDEDQVFFGERKLELASRLRIGLGALGGFESNLSVRRARLVSGRDPSIDEADSPFSVEDYTGFADPFWLASLSLQTTLDTRRPRDPYVAGSGMRVRGRGEMNYGPGTEHLAFLTTSLSPTVFWDITGIGHVLSFRVFAEALFDFGRADVPLNETVALGGGENLRAFLPGRFRGESALVYSLDYAWPLLSFLDTFLFVEVGNAFSGFFEDFSHDEMVLDWGMGWKSTFSREVSLWLAFGFGTNQIEEYSDGFVVENIRFFAGATHAF